MSFRPFGRLRINWPSAKPESSWVYQRTQALSGYAGNYLIAGFRPDETTSHSTKLANNTSKVAGYAPE
jgi:hypothetical protein